MSCDCPDNEQEYAMQQLSMEDWQMVSSKCLVSSWPQYYYIDNNWPQKNVHVWPIPSQNYTARLYVKEQLSELTDLDAEIDLPHGYDWMLIHQVALALCPDFKIQPSPGLLMEAERSMAVVKRKNETVDYQYADPAFNQGGQQKRSQIPQNYGRTSAK